MGTNVKKQFVVDLTLNTKDAEKQLKATAQNMKAVMANMGKASDKMGYFKELVDYIKQIDTAMTALKNKDSVKFNDLFSGLDGNLKQTFESLFGVVSKDMSALDDLRNKLNNLDANKVSVTELRTIAQDINSLFVSLGKLPPLDIEQHFSGRGNAAERMQMLTEQLNNFATVWAGVNQKLQQGFGGGAVDIGAGLPEAVQQQINKLESEINHYQSLLSKLDQISKMQKSLDAGKRIQLDFEATEESARQLIDRFNAVYAIMETLDKSSTEYAASMAECTEIALQLEQVSANLAKTDKLGNIIKDSPKFLRDFLYGDEPLGSYVVEDFEHEFKDIQSVLKNAIENAKKEILRIKTEASKITPKTPTGTGTGSGGTGSGGNGTGTGSAGPIDVDFTSLENTIKSEMATINAKLNDVLKVELVKDDTKNLGSAIESIKANIEHISSLVETYKTSKASTAEQNELANMKSNLSQLLQFVSEFNNRKTIHGEYQHQELRAAILSDGSISAEYGEHGTVPWDRMANLLLANLTKTLLVDIHSHPWAEFLNGKKYANDSFSGSSGDLGAFRRSKELGSQIAAMITGNIMRTLDLSKLTDAQMKQFRSALSGIEKQYANTPEYSKYMAYDANTDKLYYKRQSNLADQHKVTEAFESLMYKAFEQIGFSKDQVDHDIFKKYNLTDDAQLTELAERLVKLTHASQNALSPVERLSQIISQFGGDTNTDRAKAALKSYEKGERSAADVFNFLNNGGYTLHQDTIDSLMHIDSANEMSPIESLLTKVSGILETIRSSVSTIESNTRLTTEDQAGYAINDLNNIKNGFGINKYFTAGIKSIFDQSNISESKNKEVLSLADEAITRFHGSFNDLLNNGTDNVNAAELNGVLHNFKVAMSYISDATDQILLYEGRTGKSVKDGSAFALDTLSSNYEQLTDSSIIDKLLSLMQQSRLGLTDTYNTSAHAVSDSGYISQLFSALSALTSTIEALILQFKTYDLNSSSRNAQSFNTSQIAGSSAVHPNESYALEATLLNTNNILGQILTAIGNNDSVVQLVEPLKSAIAELKSLMSNIMQYQGAQKAKLLPANDRIASDYEGLVNRAKNTVAGFGDEIKIKQLSALENGIVRVEGATRDANGVWKGFIVDIDNANNTTVRAINEQSKFATSLNKSAEEAARLKQESQQIFDNKLKTQTDIFADFKNDTQDSIGLTDKLKEKLDQLEQELKQVTSSADLDAWIVKFSNLQKTFEQSTKTMKQQRIGEANKLKKDLGVDFGKLDFRATDENLSLERQRLVQEYQNIDKLIEDYITDIRLGNNVEITGIEDKIRALREQIKTYKDLHNIVDGRGGSARAYGSKDTSNATVTFNALKNTVSSDFNDNTSVKTQFAALEASYRRLIELQSKFKIGEVISDAQEQEFNTALKQFKDLEQQLSKLIGTYEKFKDASAVYNVSAGFANTDSVAREAELKRQVEQYAANFDGSTVALGKFQNDYNSLLFTIDKGNGVIEKMKASFDTTKRSIIFTSVEANRSVSMLSRAWSDIKAKTSSLLKYYTSTMGIHGVIRVLRQGITYIREIDTALTELKKVTSETASTYDNFLQTASKTASVLGGTVSDFVSATADFARLGYTLQEASQLAEAATVYKNVGDGITDVSQASESIISTMKAFGVEATDVMGIIDRFNEVGNNFAISSTGIGEAMQRSASALYEAGNTIDESIALITGANSVVQNPEQVGTALKTLALRLRGAKTE